MIVFDIDGTILDMRYMVHYVLQSYDRAHGTHFFRTLEISDITVHENHVTELLIRRGIPPEHHSAILEWYTENRWIPQAILESHRPYSSVLEVIRWFQIQPNCFVGLNTGRPESIRESTLRSLNRLGESYRVHFDSDLLHMNSNGWHANVQNAKVAGIQAFRDKGYRVFAVVDNEPENLEAIASIAPPEEMLLLHANTLFESKRSRLPQNVVEGDVYDLTELIPEKELPHQVQFVWHGLNDEANLRQFLASDILWGECDIHLDPRTDDLVLHHDEIAAPPAAEVDEWLTLEKLLARLRQRGKWVKLDLKGGGELVDKALELLSHYDFGDSRLWFNGYVNHMREEGFRKIAKAYPNAIIQCPIDFLEPLVCSIPDKTKEILDTFQSWGINRFSINWLSSERQQFFDQMDRWGLDVNIYGVYDLESFLKAVLLMPCSVTSDFNFPKWYYFGRGAGQKGTYYEYEIRNNHGRRPNGP